MAIVSPVIYELKMEFYRRLFFTVLIAIVGVLLVSCGSSGTKSGTTVIPDTKPAVEVEPPAGDTQECEDGDDSCDNPDLCAACTNDSDCGTGECKTDSRGLGFCTEQCDYFGSGACPRDFYCKQFGTTPQDFYCSPVTGTCAEDDQDCAACESDSDCGNGLICYKTPSGVRFCARKCSGDGTCPAEYPNLSCGHVEGDSESYCFPKIGGLPSAKCGAYPLSFCEPCEEDSECDTGKCVASPNIGAVCSMSCGSTDECPPGTDCVHDACVPPIAYGCQGFLSCFGVECPTGHQCYHGFCFAAP
jgi:hypothetical protein